MPAREPLNLSSILTWGPYEGRTLKCAIDKDLKYVEVLVEDITWLDLDSKTWAYFQDKLESSKKTCKTLQN